MVITILLERHLGWGLESTSWISALEHTLVDTGDWFYFRNQISLGALYSAKQQVTLRNMIILKMLACSYFQMIAHMENPRESTSYENKWVQKVFLIPNQ